MGYTTTFEGEFTFDKPLTSKHRAHLVAFAKVRHDRADVPGIYCQWVPNEDGTALLWDGTEKFYDYIEWLDFLIARFIAPWGYVLNGSVAWEGENSSDTGTITVTDNAVEAVATETAMKTSDFAELDALLKSGTIDKESIWINVDEDIVRVFADEDIIFEAEPVHFVNAFFMLYGINIDENIENREA